MKQADQVSLTLDNVLDNAHELYGAGIIRKRHMNDLYAICQLAMHEYAI
jgi:hypothetical protein